MAASNPKRWVTVDATLPPEEMAELVLGRTLEALESTRAAAVGS
jgi:hypothetical protein